ncbi:hypothetical protein EV421DRAFT_1746683 [Armillaria borealis]|uniref:Uncharacterized protein n=1 Tax=Armillaria borealis TaxID=47425 RepID=A0AA39M5V6_9AGAR|nr:hypothetical protein EV421DRAFT_1746683 [Armillaria borealis]
MALTPFSSDSGRLLSCFAFLGQFSLLGISAPHLDATETDWRRGAAYHDRQPFGLNTNSRLDTFMVHATYPFFVHGFSVLTGMTISNHSSMTLLFKYTLAQSPSSDIYNGSASRDFCRPFWGLDEAGLSISFWPQGRVGESPHRTVKRVKGKDEIGDLHNVLDTLKLDRQQYTPGDAREFICADVDVLGNAGPRHFTLTIHVHGVSESSKSHSSPSSSVFNITEFTPPRLFAFSGPFRAC